MEDLEKWKTTLNEASHIYGVLFKTDERLIHTLLIADLELYALEIL